MVHSVLIILFAIAFFVAEYSSLPPGIVLSVSMQTARFLGMLVGPLIGISLILLIASASTGRPLLSIALVDLTLSLIHAAIALPGVQ